MPTEFSCPTYLVINLYTHTHTPRGCGFRRVSPLSSSHEEMKWGHRLLACTRAMENPPQKRPDFWLRPGFGLYSLGGGGVGSCVFCSGAHPKKGDGSPLFPNPTLPPKKGIALASCFQWGTLGVSSQAGDHLEWGPESPEAVSWGGVGWMEPRAWCFTLVWDGLAVGCGAGWGGLGCT